MAPCGRSMEFAGRLKGIALLFEALILMPPQQMTFRAVGRIVGDSAHRVLGMCPLYVPGNCGLADDGEG